ncbi:MAG TPA: RNA 2',3'-cyclic phosphodiesterase [Alphaproteobacteria bacterium]|nr:RNA 2',3'-cyclic phosphodiesterase [Alphaproteobacteria bacterium]
MLRLFVAIELPESLRERLALLCGGVPGARWLSPETMHLTLRFIGDVQEAALGDIDAALAGIHVPGFEIMLDGIGVFGNGARPRAIWAGVARNPPLEHLHGKIESALVRTGLPPEGRKFTPHVTLGRAKAANPGRVGDFVAAHNPFQAGPFKALGFTLFSSFLSHSGAIHTPEAVYRLQLA